MCWWVVVQNYLELFTKLGVHIDHLNTLGQILGLDNTVLINIKKVEHKPHPVSIDICDQSLIELFNKFGKIYSTKFDASCHDPEQLTIQKFDFMTPILWQLSLQWVMVYVGFMFVPFLVRRRWRHSNKREKSP